MWKKTKTDKIKKGDKVRVKDGGETKTGIVARVAAFRFIFLEANPSEGIGSYEVERFEESKLKDDEE